AFLVAGIFGLRVVMRPTTGLAESRNLVDGHDHSGRGSNFLDARERAPWIALFVGSVLSAFGSAWYHLAPDHARLAFDRLPMTIVFMSLFAAVLNERVRVPVGTNDYARAPVGTNDYARVPVGTRWFVPMLLLGIG